MNFNKTTEYAFRILSFMAEDESRIYSVDEIFKKLQIPYRYLRKLMNNLTKSEFIESVQGKSGGYKISKKLEDIKLLDILNAVDPDYLLAKCFFGFDICALQPTCAMHDQWMDVRIKISTILTNTSLVDIKQGNNQNQILTDTIHSLKI
jgi:Rrf2 family transcriptional regulator, nitric oxide-sensitive transcriptional repressor